METILRKKDNTMSERHGRMWVRQLTGEPIFIIKVRCVNEEVTFFKGKNDA